MDEKTLATIALLKFPVAGQSYLEKIFEHALI